MQFKRLIVNENHRNFSGATPPILRGITPQQIKSITEKRKNRNYTVSENKMARRVKRPSSQPGPRQIIPIPDRPDDKYLTTVKGEIKRIPVPEKGSFNAGLIAFDDKYIMTYRPNEYAFSACILNKNLDIIKDSHYQFDITNCADPRLVWTPDNRLVMVYSSTEEVGARNECIRGCVIMDRNHADKFVRMKPFNISLPTIGGRQKNWMPFRHEDKIYLISSVCPHAIFEMKVLSNINAVCQKRWETSWHNPWFYKEFLRGNTNAVQLDDGNYLGTFHTAVRLGPSMHYYDNGCYVFEGNPPFNVIKCSNRTYLKAEDAVEPHVRKRNLITVCFPVGMVRDEEKLLISYGDNDSAVKILTTTVEEMLNLTVDVY
ncbi:MAG: hypothetical protein DWQ19_11800 [Crenarchaeota archaeon]|nr:MAG: hypothetical protein DWQ19_11800 [Thermoproteota archaeon]